MDIKILRTPELLQESDLQDITGGVHADDKAMCTCNCWFSNSNTTGPIMTLTDVQP